MPGCCIIGGHLLFLRLNKCSKLINGQETYEEIFFIDLFNLFLF